MAHNRKNTLRQKILIPLILMMLLEGVLIYTVIYFSGTMEVLKGNSYGIFDEKVHSRASNLSSAMINHWSNIDGDVEEVEKSLEDFLITNEISGEELVPDNKKTSELLGGLAPKLASMTQKNSVTGIFLVLEGDGGEKKSGIYFRDLNPESSKADYSDLVALRAPSAVTKNMGISLDSSWYPYFQIQKEGGNTAFYRLPFEAAKEYENLRSEDLGYWCQPFHFGGEESEGDEVITYTMPIRVNGAPLGVMGVEVSKSYLEELLPYSELNEGEQAGYLLLKESEGGYEIMFASEGTEISSLQEGGLVEIDASGRNDFYKLTGQDFSGEYLTCMRSLKLYNSNAPFEKEGWLLAGVVQEEELLSFFQRFERLILYTIIASILSAMVIAALVANRLTAPITALNKKLKRSSIGKQIRLESISIAEIDDLTGTIEKLSNEVVANASKLGTILDMAGVSIGACEYIEKSGGKVYCTGGFLRIFHYPEEKTEGLSLTAEEMQSWLGGYEKYVIEYQEEEEAVILELKDESPCRWVRFRTVNTCGKTLGVATDITSDMKEKKKMEHERDFDLLTSLYNRRAFQSRTSALFSGRKCLGLAAMVMIDLDNLKYINDSYGHDCGDEYIRTAANVIRCYRAEHAVLGRLSGDEFMVFFYEQEGKKQVLQLLQQMFEDFHETAILLPDGARMPVRASAGIAWYPDDSENLEELRKYADFAMYMVKKTNKGDFAEFSFEHYRKDSYLLRGREELNLLLEKEMVNYAFQPIVDCRTGTIFAYEALMRPDTENIQTPMALLSLARSQSKLHQVERMTMFKAMEAFTRLKGVRPDIHIFINSIANQVLTEEETLEFEQKYRAYLSRLVVEITEEEHRTDCETEKKKRVCARWGGEIAVDDYGEGYSSESILLEMEPRYVKIDRILIHDIHLKERQKSLLRSILTFTRSHGIKTVGEGVECREEMEILIQEGVDYLQGYYLAKPEFKAGEIPEQIRQEILCAGKSA